LETIDGNFQAVDDSVGLNDSISFVGTFERAVNDSVTPSDGTPSVGYALTGAESTLPLSDNVTPLEGGGGNDWTAEPSDSVTPSDALVFDRSIVLSDSATPSDALSLAREVVLEDAVSLSDALGSSLVTPSDTVTPTDGTASVGTFLTGAESSITLSDNVTPELGAGGTNWTRDVNDSVVITDSGAMFNYTVSIAETDFQVIDNITPVLDSGSESREINDSVTVSDGIDRFLAKQININDSVTPSDGITPLVSLNRTVDDAVTPSDARSFDRTFNLGDFFLVSDSISASKLHVVEINDNIGVADAISKASEAQIGIADTADVADALSKAFAFTISDIAVPLSDSVTSGGVFAHQILINDNLGASSGFGKQPVTIGRF
jgi:hypothetical protein